MLSLAKRIDRHGRSDGSSDAPVRMGPYRLCLELAAGGMATVYLAHDGSAGAGSRMVALKLLHPHLANDPGFAEMFVDEAEIASRIRHPHVCSVFDFDVTKDRSYIAMEYLLGEPLGAVWRKLARARDTSPDRSARMVAKALADACEGLHAAHELTDGDGEPLEVVHRDVSPANIVLTFDGITKVVDFGVAAAARKRHRTQTGMLKGKLGYVAPECLRGKRADRRCDVWGIGVTAWELVTGARLFRGKNDVETLRAVAEARIRRPSSVRAELPRELDDILMRALKRNPGDRYPTARELGRDLARFASEGEVITSADLGEWLEQLFPGARARKQQLLDIAAQVAAEDAGEPSPPMPVAQTASELEPTRVYDREPTTEPTAPSSRTTAPRTWPAIALALGVGVGVGGAVAWTSMRTSTRTSEAPSAPAAPVPIEAEAPPAARRPQPELRIRPGGGLARGPYVLELVDSAPDELLLRIRLDGAPEQESPAVEPEAPRTNESPPTRAPRARREIVGAPARAPRS